MKKKLTRLYYLFWAVLTVYLFLSFSGNPPQGNTGSPPTFQDCGSCHGGGSGTGMVTIAGLPATIDPNTTYPITVTVTRTNGVPQEAGFQMNALDSDNNDFGSFSNAGANSQVQGAYFEHLNAPSFGGNDDVSFTVDWTSPGSGNTTVTMYAAGNLANGNGNTGGDAIVLTSESGMFMGSAGQINVSVTGTDVDCFGGNNGTATATPSGGGGPPYTYAWSNGGNTQTITNLTAGFYSVTVTNANGDPGMGDITINEPATPVTALITNTVGITCSNPVGSATAEGSGGTPNPGYTYNWSNGMMGATINVSIGGDYTVTVTDGNDCTATATATITEDTTPPIANAGPPMSIDCTNPTAILDGTASSIGGNFSYLWTTTDGNIVNGATTLTPEVDAAGTYELTVSNTDNGCTAVDATTVVSNMNFPAAVVAAPDTLDCNTSSIVLDGSASSSGPDIVYLWTTVNGNIVSGETTDMATVDAAGDYTFTVTDNSNGCVSSTNVTVTSDTTPPTASAGADMTLNCNNTQVVLDGSGSSSGPEFTYLWTTSNGNIVSGETTAMPTVDAEGTYALVVTNTDNGCTSTDTAMVTQTPMLAASISDTTHIDCNGNSNGSTTAAGSGGNGTYSYNWSNGGMTQAIMNLAAGNYTVTITDDDNCTATATVEITEPPALTINVTTMDVSGPGNDDGSATANPGGGIGPYTYDWDNGGTTQTIMNLAPGTYMVTVTDDNDCTITGSGTVSSFDCSGFSASTSSTDVSCNGGSDGTASASASGGSMPYSYLWSNGQTTQTAIDLTADDYSVTITDDDGCDVVLTVSVSEPPSVAVSSSNVKNVSCNGGMDGSISVGATGGNGGFEYLWSNNMMGATISNLSAGDYTVTATDTLGCSGMLTVMVTEPTALVVAEDTIANVLCNGDSTGMATVSASGGTPNYTYAWSDGHAGATNSMLPAGNHEVIATDLNGCMDTLGISISEPPALAANVTSTDETGVGTNDGTASSAPAGGTADYTYAWNNGENTPTITDLPPGEYCVTVTDDNGCTVEDCTTVNAFACAGVSSATSGTPVSCFGGNDGTASVMPDGFVDPILYLWSNDSTTATINGLTAGIYSVTITGDDGCTGTNEYEVTSPTEVSVDSVNVTNTECTDSDDGSITVMGEGGTPGYTYLWSGGSTTATIDSLESGSYSVTVTDTNGCTANRNFEVGTDDDTEFPNVVVQDITVALDSNGMATITPAMIDNGSTDNCGIDTMVLDFSMFNCDDLGVNPVILAVQDLSGNCGFDSAFVTVIDTIVPTITCPDDIVIQSDNCEEMVDYDPPIFDDNCVVDTFAVISGLPSGSTFPSGTTTNTLEVMDSSGNSASCSFDITIDNGFSGSATATDITCNGFADGTATATPTGGQSPFTYAWNDSNNQTTQTAIGLDSGTYMATITDGEGCTTVVTVEVDEPDPLAITVDSVTDETLTNMDGAIEITVGGGVGGYTYSWTFAGDSIVVSNDEDPTGLSAGDYIVIVTDENGCLISSDSITVGTFVNTLNPSLERFVDIYPNPATDRLSLQFDLPAISEVSISLFDLNGKLSTSTVKDYFSNKSVSLALNDVATGLYIVRIVIDNEVLVKRIIVSE